MFIVSIFQYLLYIQPWISQVIYMKLFVLLNSGPTRLTLRKHKAIPEANYWIGLKSVLYVLYLGINE